MSRNAVLSLVGVAVLAGVGFLLFRESVLGAFGPGTTSIDESDADGSKAPSTLESADGATSGTTSPSGGSKGAPALAAGGKHPERAGVGRVTAKVLAATGDKPIAGAVLALKGTGHGGEAVDARGTTGADGLVKLTGVAAGVGFVARVEVEGEPPVEVPDVEVKAGRVVDLGAIQIGARVDVVGRVVDEKGAGIAGADVRALRSFSNPLEMISNFADLIASMGREPTPIAKTTSAADGAFRLIGVPPATVAVRATLPGRLQALATVRVTPEGAVPPTTSLVLQPGATVSGVVVDSSGPGISGATVALMEEGSSDFSDIFAGRVFTKTDAQGRFEAVVSPKTSALRAIVEADGFPTTMGPRIEPGSSSTKIVLHRGVDVEVTMLAEGTEEPVPDVTIALFVGDTAQVDGPDQEGALASGVTDARGVAHVPVRAGMVSQVLVSHATYGFSMLSPASPDGGMGGSVVGTFPPKVTAGGTTRVTLHLKKSLWLEGVVKSSSGAPIAGAEVKGLAIFGAGGGGGVKTDAQGAYRIALSGSSMFGPGGSMIVVSAPGYVSATETPKVDDQSQSTGTIHHDVTLKAGATIRGKVVDADGKPVAGVKIAYSGGGFDAAALMAMMAGGGGGANLTDSTGAYVLRDVAPGGGSFSFTPGDDGSSTMETKRGAKPTAHVTASAEGYVTAASDEFEVKEGATVDAPTLRLSRGATIKGTVRDPGGHATAATIDVHVKPKKPTDSGFDFMSMTRGARKVEADAEGHFEVNSLAEGTVTLTASIKGAASTRRTVTVESESESPTVEIAMRAGSDLKGVVLDPDGRPVAKATVSVEGELLGRSGDDAFVEPESAKTDAEGRFSIAGLPPGSVKLSARADGFHSASVQTPTSGTVEIRLTARPASDTQRLAEINAEIRETSVKFMSAKDGAERTALQKRLGDLQREKRKLNAGDPEPTDAATPGK